jgi:hypothetical protein
LHAQANHKIADHIGGLFVRFRVSGQPLIPRSGYGREMTFVIPGW